MFRVPLLEAPIQTSSELFQIAPEPLTLTTPMPSAPTSERRLDTTPPELMLSTPVSPPTVPTLTADPP